MSYSKSTSYKFGSKPKGKSKYTGKRKTMSRAKPAPLPELKSLDTYADGSTIDVMSLGNDNSMVLLNGVQQGPAFYERIGRKITPKSLLIRAIYLFQYGGGTAIQSRPLRVAVVWDSQPTSSFPALNDIFDSKDENGAAINNPFLSGPNMDNRERFKILRDDVIQVDLQTPRPADTSGGVQYCYEKFIILPKGATTSFSGTSNPMTVASIERGALYLVAFQKGLVTVGDWTYLSGNNDTIVSRLRYTDN